MKNLQLFTFLILTAMGLSIASAQEPTLKSGMSILLKITGVPAKDQQDLNAAYSISDSGTIRLQYIGTVSASGLKPSQLSAAIESAYRSAEIYTKPTVNVSINGGDIMSASYVTVMGEVKAERQVAITTNMTVLSAIAQCGGFTDFADKRKVRLVRNGKEQILDLRKAGGSGDIKIQAEDTLVIKQSTGPLGALFGQ
jgi:protein involved in polysaccharide export with SLBB domain